MSYVEHFNLTDQPFRLTPDPAYVYWSKQHARAKAYMESTIWLADGFVGRVLIAGLIGPAVALLALSASLYVALRGLRAAHPADA